MPNPTVVLTALSLLTATLLASCGNPVSSQQPVPPVPQPVVRAAVTSLHLNVLPANGWAPTDETVYLIANGNGAGHLVSQGTLAGGQVTLPLPGEAALASSLYTVDTTSAPAQGCTVTQPASGTGYSVPSFKSTSLIFTAKTTTSLSGYRLLQDANLSGPAYSLVYVDRDVRVQNSATCVNSVRTDVSTLDLDLVKGWNLVTRTDSGAGPYTHVFRAAPGTEGSASLNLIGTSQATAPAP